MAELTTCNTKAIFSLINVQIQKRGWLYRDLAVLTRFNQVNTGMKRERQQETEIIFVTVSVLQLDLIFFTKSFRFGLMVQWLLN